MHYSRKATGKGRKLAVGGKGQAQLAVLTCVFVGEPEPALPGLIPPLSMTQLPICNAARPKPGLCEPQMLEGCKMKGFLKV